MFKSENVLKKKNKVLRFAMPPVQYPTGPTTNGPLIETPKSLNQLECLCENDQEIQLLNICTREYLFQYMQQKRKAGPQTLKVNLNFS